MTNFKMIKQGKVQTKIITDQTSGEQEEDFKQAINEEMAKN